MVLESGVGVSRRATLRSEFETRRNMGRRETSPAIHPDQALAKCANGQMETRLAVLLL
jgi:hypothetical protein